MALPTTPDVGQVGSQQPPAQAQGQPVPAQTEPQVDWQKEAQTAQNRFNGLMSAYNKERTDWQAAQGQLLDHQKQFETLNGQLAVLQATSKQALEQQDQFKTEAELAAAQLGRMKYVAEKHPDLLPFELKGLLPDAPAGEELEKTLVLFKQTIAGIVQQVGATGAPPPPPAQATTSQADLMAQYQTLAAQGKVEEANRILDMFFTQQRGG